MEDRGIVSSNSSAADQPGQPVSMAAEAEVVAAGMGAQQSAQKTVHKRKGPRPRRVPLRTCIACQQERPKRELIRVVRTPDGHVLLDPTSKKSGRGAYLCARRSCWELALQKGKLEHALGVTISPEDRAALDEYVTSLPPEAPGSAGKATRARLAKKPTPTSGAAS
ncbi:MAG TPA: YlxR family protein [Ktedonobacterales bacterium]|nr:YlxR family protein [Ktedonobacterales bacterium]